MWEYKITKTILGYNIYKKREKDGIMSLWFLGPEGKWVLDKTYAKTFYTEDDAKGALFIMPRKDAKGTD